MYSCGVVAWWRCHHEYLCTTYGGLRVGRYSVLPSYSRVFSRFYQGYLGFARSSRLFVMFGLKTIFDGKKNVTKRVFLFQKISFVNKNGGFQGHFNGLQRVWHSWHISHQWAQSCGLKIVKLKHYMQPNKMFWILPFYCIFCPFLTDGHFKNGLLTQENLSINSRVSIHRIGH